MKNSLSSRLATLYTVLLGVTVLIVVIASSIALVFQLAGYTRDIIIAKHEEARIMAAQFKAEGVSLKKGAPQIARDLGGLGLRVAVFDTKGAFLGGDRSLHPHILDRVVHGQVKLPPLEAARVSIIEAVPMLESGKLPPPQMTVGRLIYRLDPRVNALLQSSGMTKGAALVLHTGALGAAPRMDPWMITPVEGGYVTFAPSPWLIATNLFPYWRIMLAIAIVVILGSWFIGRLFSRQALAPLNEVSDSLRALAGGDYTQRRFITASGDEVAQLTEAYNDAAASVAVAMDERKTTEARMRQFVADAGHELRTPLTVLAGYIDVLRRGALEEPKVAKQILATMAIEKEHMRGLIDRLMRLARMDAEAPPQVAEIDVRDLLRDQVEAARRLDERRQIDYSIDGLKEVVGDRAEIGEALWNVVENALKYAPDAPVHLSAYRENGSAVFSVSDEGPGMSESERLHAFERFYRGDARGEIPGTGLGLSIAKRAVERSGGKIAIRSSPGRGTTVTIQLPKT